jgi:cytidylate kinase
MPGYIEELVNQQVLRSELAKQRNLQEGKHCKNCVVTISRRMGSGARVIAEKLAQETGWSLWDRELVDAIAQDAHVSRQLVDAFDEKTISEIDLLVRAALGSYQMDGFVYAKHLTRAVASIAKLGNAIILGRGANFLLPDALNIRIDAPDQQRISNMMKYEGLTRDRAEIRIRESDREREHIIKTIFGKHPSDIAYNDLTISIQQFSNDDAVELIMKAIKLRFAPKE